MMIRFIRIRQRFVLLLAAASLALLSACGGGGGGGVRLTGGVLRVITDWTDSANPGGGLSELLDLYDANGFLVQQVEIDKTSPSTQNTDFASQPAGTYHLHGRLYSQLGAGGVLTGEFDALVRLTPDCLVQIDVGTSPNAVSVTPAAASIQAQFSQQFYAAGADGASGHITYLQPNSVAWSENGGVSTVGSSTGIAIGQSAGAGSIEATYTPTNPAGPALLGAGVLDVSAFNVQSNEWTVFVYIDAANNLVDFSKPNVLQMQRVSDQPANLRFVVQWKESATKYGSLAQDFVGTRRYLITFSTTSKITSTLMQDLGPNIDMGSPQTMADFLNWGKAYFPSARTCVVGWDHGNGWAPGRMLAHKKPTRGWSYDFDTGNNIDTQQFVQSLGSMQPDIFAWDCCNMQMIEVAYEGRNTVKYMVGNEAATPAPGYPYDLVFAKFRDNPTDTTADLCKAFGDGMIQFYGVNSMNEVTQSVFDESKVPALASAIGDLGTAMVNNASSLTTLVPYIRSTADHLDDDINFGREYRDVNEVCNLLQTGGGGNLPAPAAVQSAAVAVQNALADCVVYDRKDSFFPNSAGVAFGFYTGSQFSALSADYGDLAFAADDPGWKDWLTIAP